MNEENISNELIANEVQEEIIVDTTEDTTVYDICRNINVGINSIYFIIVIIFLYKYLKNVFRKKK